MIVRATIDTSQIDQWVVFAGYKARDAREPIREALEHVVVPAIDEQIASQGSRSGDPYPDLSTKYMSDKIEEYGFAYPMLIASGQMMKDLHDDTAIRVFRDHGYYRPKNDYMQYHQEGGWIEGRPPQRVILDLITEDYDEIQDIFEAWLAELRDTNRARRGAGVMPSFDVADLFDIS